MLKISYVTIVNEHFEPYLDQLIRSHRMFSRIDLTVYTINFDIKKYNYSNIKFIEFYDENLLEFEENGNNKFINSEYEKHKYTTLLKTKILKRTSADYDYYFFIDADILLTKNSDVLVINTINKFGYSKFPISVQFYHYYSLSHGPDEPLFYESGDFNPKSLGYYPIIELYKTEFHNIPYLTTYCMYYTRECLGFLEEAEKICFDENIIKDYKKYLPLGDETVFNYLYSKYNFRDFISSYLCYDINPFLGISDVLKNIEKGKNFISFIHTKRYFISPENQKIFSNIRDDEYDLILNELTTKENTDSKINIVSCVDENDVNIVTFSLNDNYEGNFKVSLVSLFRPNKEYTYFIDLCDGVIFFVIKERDVHIKDFHLIIENNRIIKDLTRLT